MSRYSILYVIRHGETGLHKIGITNDWTRRQKELEVGPKTKAIHIVRVNDARQVEKYLHRRFAAKRMPQSEWFHLNEEELGFVRTTILKAKDDYVRAQNKKAPKEARPKHYQSKEGTNPSMPPVVDACLEDRPSTDEYTRRISLEQQGTDQNVNSRSKRNQQSGSTPQGAPAPSSHPPNKWQGISKEPQIKTFNEAVNNVLVWLTVRAIAVFFISPATASIGAALLGTPGMITLWSRGCPEAVPQRTQACIDAQALKDEGMKNGGILGIGAAIYFVLRERM